MLKLTDIDVTFNAGTALAVKALRSVSLSAKPGEFITIIGTNGAGKSTLLSAIAGDVQPGCGRIEIAGDDITAWPGEKRARMIGRVFQDPRIATCASLTVEENLALAASRGGRRGFRRACAGSAQRRHFAEQLELLGLGLHDRLDALAGTLSGGQRQAVSLMMATLLPMKILLLDEHTAALDPLAAEKVLGLSARIGGSDQLITLMVTHSMRYSLDYGTRTIMMNAGQIVFDISGEERSKYDVPDLLQLFKKTTGSAVEDDELLLS